MQTCWNTSPKDNNITILRCIFYFCFFSAFTNPLWTPSCGVLRSHAAVKRCRCARPPRDAVFSEASVPPTATCETRLCAAGRHKDFLTRGERQRGEGGFQHSRVSCHRLWRAVTGVAMETDGQTVRHSQLPCSRGGPSQMGCAWWLTSSSWCCVVGDGAGGGVGWGEASVRDRERKRERRNWNEVLQQIITPPSTHIFYSSCTSAGGEKQKGCKEMSHAGYTANSGKPGGEQKLKVS